MKIDGKQIAATMYDDLKKEVAVLKAKGIIPHLVVILVGNDPASQSYILQKRKWGVEIGAKVTVMNYPMEITTDDLIAIVKQLNGKSNVHAIIIQRPLPSHIDKAKIIEAIDPKKDVDGFHPDSPFEVPVALAVMKVLETIYINSHPGVSTKVKVVVSHSSEEDSIMAYQPLQNDKLVSWLKTRNIVVLGRGETAGGPIIALLRKNNIPHDVISSKTEHRELLIKHADIVISAVGKADIITPEMLKKDVILIGVGVFKGEDEKMHGDYVAKEVADTASHHTSAIGGIGPVNVAFLLDNLVKAAKN